MVKKSGLQMIGFISSGILIILAFLFFRTAKSLPGNYFLSGLLFISAFVVLNISIVFKIWLYSTTALSIIKLGLITIGVWIFIIYLFNSILPHFDLVNNVWVSPDIFPAKPRLGQDFYDGLYRPFQEIIHGNANSSSVYSPVASFLVLPIGLFSATRAYFIFAISLFVTNIVCIGIATKLAVEAFLHDDIGPVYKAFIEIFLAAQMVFFALTSYGFVYSIERGNFDIYALIFALIGLLVLFHSPQKLWLQILLFSIAFHLKLYPGLFLLIVLWRHGKKAIVPILVVNLALFLMLGPKFAMNYVLSMVSYAATPFITIKNSSGTSFGTILALEVSRMSGQNFNGQLFAVILTILPAVLWMAFMLILVRQPYSKIGALWLFIVSIPPMFAIPSVSHDYKLVILSAPIVMILVRCLQMLIQNKQLKSMFQILLVLLLAFLIHRSYNFLPTIFLQSKYPVLFAFQLICGWMILSDPLIGWPIKVQRVATGNLTA